MTIRILYYAKPHEKLYATRCHWTGDCSAFRPCKLRWSNQDHHAATSSASGCCQRPAGRSECTRRHNATFHLHRNRHNKSQSELVGERDCRRQRYIRNRTTANVTVTVQ
jgi:hypothetical protein